MRKTVFVPRPTFINNSAVSLVGDGLSAGAPVLRFLPNQMQVLSDYGLTLMRTGDYKKSYKIYQAPAVQRAQASETWLDGLTEVYG